MSDDAINVLKNFYDSCSEAPFLERLVEKKGRCFILSPVGFSPKLNNLVDLKNCIFCILNALKFIHSNNWTFNDIRISNVISFDNVFYLIDSEFARVIGSPRPNRLQIFDPSETTCSIASDLYMVNRLIHDTHLTLNDNWSEFCNNLDDINYRRSKTAQDLLENSLFL